MQRKEGGIKLKQNKKSLNSNSPLISIVTICYNSETSLEATILSVIKQTHKNIEYIVIDGGSTDRTIDIIKKYDDKISCWLSEPDNGISDAFNKGVAQSTGEYINFLNSDDTYCSFDTISRVADFLKRTEPAIAYGRVAVLSSDDSSVYYVQGALTRPEDFKKKMVGSHQAYFVHKSYFEKYGIFDENLRYAMDYEHILRGVFDVRVEFMDLIIANFRTGGKSDTYKRIIERFFIQKRHGIFPYFLFISSFIKFFIQQLLESLHLNSIVSAYAKRVNRR